MTTVIQYGNAPGYIRVPTFLVYKDSDIRVPSIQRNTHNFRSRGDILRHFDTYTGDYTQVHSVLRHKVSHRAGLDIQGYRNRCLSRDHNVTSGRSIDMSTDSQDRTYH